MSEWEDVAKEFGMDLDVPCSPPITVTRRMAEEIEKLRGTLKAYSEQGVRDNERIDALKSEVDTQIGHFIKAKDEANVLRGKLASVEKERDEASRETNLLKGQCQTVTEENYRLRGQLDQSKQYLKSAMEHALMFQEQRDTLKDKLVAATEHKADAMALITECQEKLAAAEKERDELLNDEHPDYSVVPKIHHENDKEIYCSQVEQIVEIKKQLAASEAREIGLRGALERVKKSNAWEHGCHFAKCHWRTRSLEHDYCPGHKALLMAAEALATEPPALLGVMKEVEEALVEIDDNGNGISANAKLAQKALASLRKAIGVRS